MDHDTFYVIVHPEFVENGAKSGLPQVQLVLERIANIPIERKGVIPWTEKPNKPYPVPNKSARIRIGGAFEDICETTQKLALILDGCTNVEIERNLSIRQKP